jgi:hypothetical protein
MSTGDWPPTSGYLTVSNTSDSTAYNGFYYSPAVTSLDALHELALRLEFGDDKEKCGECPKALECATGLLPREQYVAKTRAEHVDSYVLPCIDDGKVRLTVLSEADIAKEQQVRSQYMYPSMIPAAPATPADSPDWAPATTSITIGPYTPSQTSGTFLLQTSSALGTFQGDGTVSIEAPDGVKLGHASGSYIQQVPNSLRGGSGNSGGKR